MKIIITEINLIFVIIMLSDNWFITSISEVKKNKKKKEKI